LRKNYEAFPSIESFTAATEQLMQPASGRSCCNFDLAGCPEESSEMSPVEQLVSDQVTKSEWETGQQQRVGKALVQRGDHIGLARLNVLETLHLHPHIEKPDSHTSPDRDCLVENLGIGPSCQAAQNGLSQNDENAGPSGSPDSFCRSLDSKGSDVVMRHHPSITQHRS
jgi:hypothetical protein